MGIFRKSTFILFLAFFAANAAMEQFEQERIAANPSAVDNSRVSVYFHPAALLIGANVDMLVLYSTVEKPFSLYNSLIVKPSIWYNDYFSRIGGDIGLRHYPGGRGEGLYLQLQGGAFRISAKRDWSWDIDLKDNDEKENSGVWFDGMGYFGYAYKYAYLSIYSDTGIGYGCVLSACSLIYDINLGIGIAF
jgi:hypothetical protein